MPFRVAGECLFPHHARCGTLTSYATRNCRGDACYAEQRRYTETKKAGLPWLGSSDQRGLHERRSTPPVPVANPLVFASLIGDQQALSRQEPWLLDARCRGKDPDIFFPHTGPGVEVAQAICEVCPVRKECLAYAIEAREDHGVWGGKSERERRSIRRKRSRAAA